jgi:hypothetical protein
MRFPIFLALCFGALLSFIQPAQSSVIELPPNGSIRITGDVTTFPIFYIPVSLYVDAEVPPFAGVFEEISGYGVSAQVQIAVSSVSFYSAFSNQPGGGCRSLCETTGTLFFFGDLLPNELTITTGTYFSTYGEARVFGTHLYADLPAGFDVAPVPLPGTALLFGSLLVGFILFRRRSGVTAPRPQIQMQNWYQPLDHKR